MLGYSEEFINHSRLDLLAREASLYTREVREEGGRGFGLG